MAKTLKELLEALKNPVQKILENTRDTWSKIGSGTIFEELEGDQSEMDAFLTEFIEENPYNNI